MVEAQNRVEQLEAILADIRQHLAQGGYPAETLDAETSLAEAAAAQLKAETGSEGSGIAAAAQVLSAAPARKWLLPLLAAAALLIYLLPILLFFRESIVGKADHLLASDEVSIEISLIAIDFQKRHRHAATPAQRRTGHDSRRAAGQ